MAITLGCNPTNRGSNPCGLTKLGRNVECFTCKKVIYKKPSEIKRSKSGKHYCSRSCATIENNKYKQNNFDRDWETFYIPT